MEISDRKQAKRLLADYNFELERQVEERTQALRVSEERLRLALSATNQGFFDVDLRTGEAVVSPEYALMLGHDPETFHETDVTWRSRIHPDDRERTHQAYHAYKAGQTDQYRAEFRMQTRQDEWKWILSVGQFVAWDETGKPLRLLGTHRDISDRKIAELEREQVEAQLRQSEATLLKAQEVAHVGNWEFDIASQTITWSPEMFRIYGLEPAANAPSYGEYLQMLPVETRGRLQEYVERAIREGIPYTIEYSRTRSDGSITYHECRGEVEQDEQGQAIRIFGTALDITNLKQTELALQNLVAGTAATIGPDFFAALVRYIAATLNASHAFVTELIEGNQLRFLAAWGDGQYLPNDIVDIEGTTCAVALRQGAYHCQRDVITCFPQHPRLAVMKVESYMGIALQNRNGETMGTLCIFSRQSLADPERSEQILRVFATRASVELERQRAEAIIEQQLAAIEAAIDGIGMLRNGVYHYVNQAYLHLFGYEQADELLGKSWKCLYSPAEVRRFEQEILPQLTHQQGWQGEAIATRKDGSTFAQGVSLTLTTEGLLISVCRDISEIKDAQALITHNALHDALTGLPNRTLLLERLALAIQRTQRQEHYRYAVLFLDLDRFKVINDSLGHLVGDQLLIAIAERLKIHLRQTDLVARLGGDEFVILLEDISSTAAVTQIAERILADCQTPLTLNGNQVFTSMSIGIVLGKKSYQQATDLIRDADIAMYEAKCQGHNLYRLFDVEMHIEALNRLTLETDLRQALDQQEFTIYYQPIIELSAHQLIGFEALVRWQHPVRGLIGPNEFIPIAEETGFIQSIDRWVMHQAGQQLVNWQKRFPQFPPLKISVNLSAQDLCKANLVEDIDEVLKNTGLRGNFVILEITESLLIQDTEKIIDLLTQLNARQIQVSIDDFGTGYSSLSYLHRLPVHSLKIDRSFVSKMELDNRNYKVVSTMISLGKQLGLKTIAEGIETPQQLQLLRQLGCQFGQGYLFSKPVSAQEIEYHFLSGLGVAANFNGQTAQPAKPV